MRVIRDEAYEAFIGAPGEDWFGGSRVKKSRSTPLQPGGRVDLSLFEEAIDGGRPHPRLRVTLKDAADPAPLDAPTPPSEALTDAESFQAWLDGTLEGLADHLAGADLDVSEQASPRWFVLSITAQRKQALLAALAAALPDRAALRRILAERGADLFAGDFPYDDENTGTYHSFGHDAPFVHWLEDVLESLPAEDGEGFALLPPEQQEAVRRQRHQARLWLDHLMRHKYAHDGIRETDIEKSLGGALIDATTRHRASETPESATSLVPAFEILRIDPRGDHPHAGAHLYRDGEILRLDADSGDAKEGDAVQVEADGLRRIRSTRPASPSSGLPAAPCCEKECASTGTAAASCRPTRSRGSPGPGTATSRPSWRPWGSR